MMRQEMNGRVAVVAGGATGIGRITALAFARKGVRVVVTTDTNAMGAEDPNPPPSFPFGRFRTPLRGGECEHCLENGIT